MIYYIVKLLKLYFLKKSCNTYYVEPPNFEAIQDAIRIIYYLYKNGLTDIFIDTHIEGGVFLEVRNENKYLNFETYNDFESGETRMIIYSIDNRFENVDDYVIGELKTSETLDNVIKEYVKNYVDI